MSPSILHRLRKAKAIFLLCPLVFYDAVEAVSNCQCDSRGALNGSIDAIRFGINRETAINQRGTIQNLDSPSLSMGAGSSLLIRRRVRDIGLRRQSISRGGSVGRRRGRGGLFCDSRCFGHGRGFGGRDRRRHNNADVDLLLLSWHVDRKCIGAFEMSTGK